MMADRPSTAVSSILGHPTLNWDAFVSSGAPYAGSVLDGRRFSLCISGRYALMHVLRALNAVPGDEVLVPAYHCLAMVTPLQWMGLRPVYYPLCEGLVPDQAAILDRIGERTRAVLVVHYFGFAQSLGQLRRACDFANVALIEDCAHAFYSHNDEGDPVGGVGHYSIASPMKFIPSPDGGAVISNEPSPEISVPAGRPTFGYEAKALVDSIDRAASVGTLAGVSTAAAVSKWFRRAMRSRPQIAVPEAAEGGLGIDSQWVSVGPARLSRFLLKQASRTTIATQRRRVYESLVRGLGGTPGISLPFPTLEDGTVPYVFPIVANSGEHVFWQARKLGIQVFRWESTETQDCSQTRFLARRLLQLPCHQNITVADIERMVRTVRVAAGSKHNAEDSR